jgi:hypothetical protein
VSPQGDRCQSAYLTQIDKSFKSTTKTSSRQASIQRPKIMHLFNALGVSAVMHLRLVDFAALSFANPAVPFVSRTGRLARILLI